MQRASFPRRLAAYVTDILVIMVYASLLAAVTIMFVPQAVLTKLQGYLVALLTLTLPVILTMSFSEARFGATPGKRLWGLRVSGDATNLGLLRSLVRNVLKFLPWELAHLGIWLTPGPVFVTAPSIQSIVLIGASYTILIVQAVLVLAFKRGAHDWLSGLSVVRR